MDRRNEIYSVSVNYLPEMVVEFSRNRVFRSLLYYYNIITSRTVHNVLYMYVLFESSIYLRDCQK